MKRLIKQEFNNYGISLTDEQAEKFEIYLHFLLEENEKYNLTAITDSSEVIVKHFIDSVLAADEIKQNASVIDVGTGAGFPGVPLKILRTDIQLTLIDSLQKRVNFLEMLKEKLDIKDIKCFHSRAEDFAQKNREKFDYALSRAVAEMPTLLEYLLPFVKVGGKVIAYKGQKGDDELEKAKNAIKFLGGVFYKKLEFNKAILGERKIIILDKIAHTPAKYPRGKNLPKTKPIL